jgi:hypothetical protein
MKKHSTCNIQRPTLNGRMVSVASMGGAELERFQKYRSHHKCLDSRIARQRLGLRQPSAAFSSQHRQCKAAEGCRSPKPHGSSPPISNPGYSFYETALKVEGSMFPLFHFV